MELADSGRSDGILHNAGGHEGCGCSGQYRDGERFVRAVVDQVGMDGFNRVWTSPNTLPTKTEIAKPADWVARVHRKAES